MSNLKRDIKPELKNLWDIFEQLSRRWDYTRVFDDFLTMCIHAFGGDKSMPFRDARDKALAHYNMQEAELLNKMFYEMIRVYNEMIVVQERPWYDLFGDFYQTISSSGKASSFGQFFTPEPVCTMMAQITDNQGESCSDPCCGSGRMLLASKAHNPKAKCYAADLDPVCAKMCAINMMMHGCDGEVVCINTLSMQDFRFAYRINPGRLGIFPLEQKNSHMKALPFTERQRHG